MEKNQVTKLDLLKQFEKLDDKGVECDEYCGMCDYLGICDLLEQKLEEKREIDKFWEED